MGVSHWERPGRDKEEYWNECNGNTQINTPNSGEIQPYLFIEICRGRKINNNNNI